MSRGRCPRPQLSRRAAAKNADHVISCNGLELSKCFTLFLANFDPLPLSHFVTYSGNPRKYVTHVGPPRFLVGLVQKSRTKVPCTNSISIVRGGFCPGVLTGWFLSVPPSVTIHLLLQKVKHHFKFHVSYV